MTVAQTIETNDTVEQCNECGRSVKFGSGLFINRVLDFNDCEYRKNEMSKPFPEGDFICCECDEAKLMWNTKP